MSEEVFEKELSSGDSIMVGYEAIEENISTWNDGYGKTAVVKWISW